MGHANLLFLLLATTTQLSVAQQLTHRTAKPSTVWINTAITAYSYNYYLDQVPIVTCYPQPRASSGFKPAITAGFLSLCASDTCDAYLFAVFIVHVVDNSTRVGDSPQVLWSANRNRPVRENATLEFSSDGNLVLHDADGSHVWSSNSSGRSVDGMVITESGNLVLFDRRNATVWQSFDYPTDTMVPGQSLVEGMRLIASTSATNTMENQLYVTVLQDGLYAYVESTPSQLYFSYNSIISKVGNDPTKATFMDGSLSIVVRPDVNDRISLPAVKSTQYMRLDSDGHLRLYEWSTAGSTAVYDVMAINVCDYPTVCGEYGICSEGQCTCPLENGSSSTSFKLVDVRNPNLGCTPLIPISCREIQSHQLLTLTGVSYFDMNYTVVNATTKDDCKQACLKNCSCRAVIFRVGECVWLTKVFSLQSVQPGYSSAYLKVQLSPPISASTSNEKKILGATLGAIATTLALLLIAIILYLKRRRKYEEKDEEFNFDQLPGTPKRFYFENLNECTKGCSKKLGEGGFGSVFEGKIGEERVAVKRLEGARQGKKEFLAEVETIGSIEHINLVKLIGFCAEKSERLLVYEYMSRGSLDRWIYYRHNNAPLDWYTRYNIILDIAKGLCYLHEGCRRKIAHLDIKPQNILLDDNFNAKVVDFGLFKLINRDQSKIMTVMRGTPGYLAPEWLTSRITEKVDVYSFGIVVMEILCGRKNIDDSQPEENVQLINLLREKAQNSQLIDLIDKHSDDMISHQEEVIEMMKLAIWCLQNDSIQRPSMSTVIKVLEGVMSAETFDANSIMFVQDNPSTYSVPSQASILSGPR